MTAFGSPLATTISVGAALTESSESADALIQRCDAALYHAKAAGRDGWQLAERPNVTGAFFAT